jgi:hypothetical protein
VFSFWITVVAFGVLAVGVQPQCTCGR